MFQPKPAKGYSYLLIFIILPFLCIGSAYAQLIADFTTDKTGGCPGGLEVAFTNTTKGASAAATYKWDFGNKRTSVNKDGKTIYTDIGTYTAILTVTDGGATSSKNITITVYKPPSIDFTAQPVKGCTPLDVTFTANAIAYDGASVSSYSWDFGDGTTQQSTTAAISHKYTGERTPPVLVTVKDSHGCVSISSVKSDIQVLSAVKASFTADKNVLCTTADKVSFLSNSTGPGTLSYTWDFGDNSSSTGAAPSHNYSAKGDYKVKLTVNSSEGCSAVYELPKAINVANFNVDFTVPAVACTNSNAQFNATATPAPDLLSWTFGNGGTGYGSIGNYTYTATGTYDVILTARYNTCNITATKQVKVNKSPALKGFIIENNGVCGAPATVLFRDTSSAAVKWLWSISGATTQTSSYRFTSNGGYGIWLTVTDATGCSTTTSKSIELRETYATIGYSRSSSLYGLRGCDALTVKFNATSSTKIASYSWDFGDGGSSKEEEPEYKFTKPGFYTVTLSFVTEDGCKGKGSALVSLYQKPTATFSMENTNPVCGNTPVKFNAVSPVTVDSWIWNFEGETSAAYYRGANATYQYLKEGTYTVRLITENGGGVCRDTIVKTNYVKVIPPFPKVNLPQNTCAGMRNTVTFTESSRQANEWIWDFGDGNKTSYTSFKSSVTHNYDKSGKYNVVLTTVNGQCAVKDSIPAYVLLKQTPVLTVGRPEICGHDVVAITVTNTDVNPYYQSYQYGGSNFLVSGIQYDKTGTPFTGSNSYTNYTWTYSYKGTLSGLLPGKDSIRAITTTGSPFGCQDTTDFVKLHIKGPIAAYKYTANNVCFNTPNKFLEQSALPDQVPIVLWTWSYGDGKTESYTKGPEASHVYASPGNYYPSLKVTDKDGCYNTIYSNAVNAPIAVITGPKADFNWSPDPVKPGNTVYYNNLTTYNANTQYTWSFSYDGTTSTLFNPSKKYDKILVDEVKLVAKNTSSGCIDSIIKKVAVKNIHAAFSYTVTYSKSNNCPPMVAIFSNRSTDYTRIKWDFGDKGATADNLNTVAHTYDKPGKYTVRLYAYDNNDGIDSADQIIEVNGPFSDFVVDVAQICGVPATIHFTANPLNVTDFTWDFGNGELSGSKNFDTTYTYTIPGKYYPAVIVKDALGCSFSFGLNEPFVIDTLKIGFSKKPVVICDSADVHFTPAVVNIAADEFQLPLIYHWDFGTGNPDDTANVADPVFRYKGAGGEQFNAHLTVQSSAGCVEEANEVITIVRATKGSIAAVPEICQFDTAFFKGSADGPVRSWKWEFADNGATVSGKTEVSHPYNTGDDYKVLLLVENEGCTDTAEHLLKVHFLPDVALASKNVLLCLGDSVRLEAHNGVQYQWTPATAITDAAIAAPAVFPVTDTRYKVVVIDPYGCVNKDSVQVKLSYPFTVSTVQDMTVCKGDAVQISATGAITYKWIEGNNLGNVRVASQVVAAAATSRYRVVGYGNDDCFTDTAGFIMIVKPVPAIKTIADTTLVAGFSLPLTTKASADVIRYAWSPGFYLDCSNCRSPVSTPKIHMNYVVTATNQYNCIAKDTVAVTLRCAESTVFIPNTFTPNKDKRNDLFYPRGKGIRQVKWFRIYNRLGELIFERTNFMINDAAQGWDGSFMGKTLTSGVFTYLTDMICDAGDVFSMKGTIMLIK
jgi:gliding motility-associated-like protein